MSHTTHAVRRNWHDAVETLQQRRLSMKVPSVLASLLTGCLLSASAGSGIAAGPEAPVPMASTRDGVVEGRKQDGLDVFLGIPFAAPPIGASRWKEPQAVAGWAGTRKADAYAASCMQKPGIPVSAGGTAGALSEDCLYLNVWTPQADAGGKRPVMVWIHGGALVYGSGNVALYDGSAYARRGAVVVTINYRMGALGFFSHPAIDGDDPSAPVNYGLFDQIAALRWVRDNIAAFGGDPGNVTLFGESAGAQSVLALYASPRARGLFNRGIAQSPYAIPSHSRSRAREVSVQVASAVGLDGAGATAAQLRAVPAERFFGLGDKGPTLAPGFIVGDAALPQPILDTFRKRKQAQLPLIVGSNSDEATVAAAFGVDPAKLVEKLRAGKFLLKTLYPGVDDDAQLGRETVRDLVFTAYARQIAYLHSRSAPVWRYYFSHVQQGLQGKVPGVGHGGEIPFVMDTRDDCGCLLAPFTIADRDFARQVGDYWYAFARSGDPGVSGAPAWERDSARKAQLLEFGERVVARKDFMNARLNAFMVTTKVADALRKARN
ncbi:carboxylesterase [Pseudoxanthomonas yeongjuensis]|nr:carboxylesterase [Pseudoxanthomonas yeongjuensis]